jgi:hypothetical protein
MLGVVILSIGCGLFLLGAASIVIGLLREFDSDTSFILGYAGVFVSIIGFTMAMASLKHVIAPLTCFLGG